MITTYRSSVDTGKLGTSISPLPLQPYEGPLESHPISQIDIVVQSVFALQLSPIIKKSVNALHQSKTNISILYLFL